MSSDKLAVDLCVLPGETIIHQPKFYKDTLHTSHHHLSDFNVSIILQYRALFCYYNCSFVTF